MYKKEITLTDLKTIKQLGIMGYSVSEKGGGGGWGRT